MDRKAIGWIIAVLLLGTMIVFMIKPYVNEANPIEEVPINEEKLDEEIELDGLEIGQVAPHLELTNLTGQSVKLSDFKGKKILLNFWATWCGPCKGEMPHMERFYQDAENVEVIAVNLTVSERDGVEAVKHFAEAYDLTFPILLDEDGEIMKLYEVLTVPTAYILGTDGKVAQMIRGPMDESAMKDLIEQVQ